MNKKNNIKDHKSQEFYSRLYAGDSVAKEHIFLFEYFINRVNIFPSFKKKKLLDAGCGRGILGKLLHDRFLIDSYGIDINKVGVLQARKNGIKAEVADLEKKWPFKDATFDAVVSVQVVEHLVNVDAFLKEANRVLKKKGIIIITTPNLASWFNRIIFLFGYQPFFLEVSTVDKTIGLKFTRKLTANREPLGHVRGFTLRALHDILDLHGYAVVNSIGGEVNYLPSYMQFVDKFFGRFPSLATDLIVIAQKK